MLNGFTTDHSPRRADGKGSNFSRITMTECSGPNGKGSSSRRQDIGDVKTIPVQSGHCPPGTIEKVTCWPEPEVKNSIDMTSGKLGLTDHEDLIVIFLGTLTDGFTTPYPDADKYTGNCLPPTALSPPPPPVSAAPVPPGLTPPPL
jgi:hypothetical protein